MKAIILAAGQGTRLRPLTNEQPKCMVEVSGISIVRRQLETMRLCNILEQDISIVCGYKQEVLREHLKDTNVHFIENPDYESTNMVCSLMCAKELLEDEVIVSYGDIIYTPEVLKKLFASTAELSVVVDDDWFDYWSERCEDPTSDAETLKFDENGFIREIGQKTNDRREIESQYIGLMKYSTAGAKKVLALAKEAQRRSKNGEALWRTVRNYDKMYMTDLLQGLIDKGNLLMPVHIQRGWFEIDCPEDLTVAEKNLSI